MVYCYLCKLLRAHSICPQLICIIGFGRLKARHEPVSQTISYSNSQLIRMNWWTNERISDRTSELMNKGMKERVSEWRTNDLIYGDRKFLPNPLFSSSAGRKAVRVSEWESCNNYSYGNSNSDSNSVRLQVMKGSGLRAPGSGLHDKTFGAPGLQTRPSYPSPP